MWDNKNSKIFGGRKSKRNSLKMYRASGEMKLAAALGEGQPPQVIAVRMILTDFRPTGIDLFAPQDLELGKEVALTIEGPRRFFCKGRVIARQEVQDVANIIRSKKFKYRLGIKFIFESAEEEQAALDYAKGVNGITTFLPVPAGEKKAASAAPVAPAGPVADKKDEPKAA